MKFLGLTVGLPKRNDGISSQGAHSLGWHWCLRIWGSWTQQLLLQLTAPSYRFMTDPSKQMKLRSTLPSLAFILRDCAHFWVNGSSLLILPKQGCSVADFWIWYMNFLQQKSSGGTQVSGLLAHVAVVKVWGSGMSSASGMLNMCLTCQLLWMTVNAWLPQWYTYFFYPSQSSTNSTTSLWPRRYQLGSKVKKDTYI